MCAGGSPAPPAFLGNTGFAERGLRLGAAITMAQIPKPESLMLVPGPQGVPRFQGMTSMEKLD